MTSSPFLLLRASTGFVSSAGTVLPDCNWPAVAICPLFPETAACCDAPAEVFELAVAPDLFAETEVPCDADAPLCMSAELWARHKAESKAPVNSEAIVLFM